VNLSLEMLIELRRTSAYFSYWGMLLHVAGDGVHLYLTNFASRKIRGVVKDWNSPKMSSGVQFRGSSSKNTPNLGQ